VQEVQQRAGEADWLVLVREVPGPFEDFKPAAGDRRVRGVCMRGGDHGVLCAPDDQDRSSFGEVEAVSAADALPTGPHPTTLLSVCTNADRVGVSARVA